MKTLLYAWANPLSAWKGADHTWVTSYPDPFGCPPSADYWFCWGACHLAGQGTTARLLVTRIGNSAWARCICAPNSSKAHGGINLYGVEGVCHQLANRVLYATGPSPVTVNGAHMYWLSHLLFGTYGTTILDWAKRKRRCSASQSAKARMNKSDLAILDARIRKRLGPRYTADVITKLHALQFELLAEKKQLDEEVVSGLLDGGEFANRVNSLINRFIVKTAEVIGAKECAEIFGAEPGEKIVVVRPDIAQTVRYSPKK